MFMFNFSDVKQLLTAEITFKKEAVKQKWKANYLHFSFFYINLIDSEFYFNIWNFLTLNEVTSHWVKVL